MVKKLVLVLVIVGCSLVVLWCAFLDFAYSINAHAHRLMCENTLKAIARAIELYEADFDGALPPSLLELNPYVEKKYRRSGPKGIRCPGDRGENETSDSWDYVYQPSLSNIAVRPVCWDSKPHHSKGIVLPDVVRWNVLYSDGHIETLNHRKFFKELLRFVSRKPDVLAKMELPSGRKRGTLPTFLIGLLIGIGVTYLTLRRKKKTSSWGKSRAT